MWWVDGRLAGQSYALLYGLLALMQSVTVLAHMAVLLSIGQGVISSVLSDDNALLLEAKLGVGVSTRTGYVLYF